MKRFLLLAVALIAAFAGGVAWNRWTGSRPASNSTGPRKILYWVDPMHPAYKSDKPGIAPDCGMKLVAVYEDGGPADASIPAKPLTGKILYYADPQRPSYHAENPGLNPETGNELKPVYENDAGSMAVGTVKIDAEKQQLLNVRFGTVEMASETATIHAAGKVAMDETRLAHVHTRVEGWIDQVFVDFTGKSVRKGQPLLTMYSPDMLATQQELLLALKGRDQLQHSTLPGVPDHMDQLIVATKRRLELWNLTDQQIDEVIRTGKPIKNITVYSPADGYITTRNAFPNQQVKPDMELYAIVDLSRVWLIADVFEYEAGSIRLGMPATISFAYDAEQKFNGVVSFIQPQVDPVTRTLKVRIEAANPGMRLKPEMFVDVDFKLATQAKLSVPAEAVLNSGERRTVFVDRGNGYFEPRDVQTGQVFGGRVEVLRGLKAGERIVTSGNFLIDSESQLKSAAQGMGGMAGHQHGAGAMPAAGRKPDAGKNPEHHHD